MTTPQWLKLAGVLAGLAASALGSYSAAKGNARAEADESYKELKQAVQHLEETQRMIWDVVMKQPAGLTKSLDGDAEPLARPFPGLRPLPRNLDSMMSRK